MDILDPINRRLDELRAQMACVWYEMPEYPDYTAKKRILDEKAAAREAVVDAIRDSLDEMLASQPTDQNTKYAELHGKL